jgi:hypothetical protein
MRGRIFFSVLLGLSMAALPAFAYRFPREKPAHETPGKPDRPGNAVERSRPGEDGTQISRAEASKGSQGRVQERGRTGTRPGGIATPGQASSNGGGGSRMACNEADECHMSSGATQAAIKRAAASQAPGKGAWGKVNNAKGKSMIANRTMSMRSVCNEADECTLGKAGAQAVVFKAAHSRAPGNGGFGKINNAKGKSLLGRASPSSRMACNEAEECSMGNSGAKAEWQKAEKRSRHP